MGNNAATASDGLDPCPTEKDPGDFSKEACQPSRVRQMFSARAPFRLSGICGIGRSNYAPICNLSTSTLTFSNTTYSFSYMPRRKNLKPTTIYCLVDMRPETIAAGWKGGKPFYVGKTVATPHERFRDHRCRARRYPKRKLSKAIAGCGVANVRIYSIEVVPPDADWIAREVFWIEHVRAINPDCANVGRGGEGPAGMVHTPESRAKMSAIHSNRSAEWCNRISVGRSGIKASKEACRKMSETRKGRKLSAEHIAKVVAYHRGAKRSPESRARMSIARAKDMAQRKAVKAANASLSPLVLESNVSAVPLAD